MQLRDYQKECVNTVNSLPDGSRSICAIATGLGKTYIASNFDFKGRVLWLSHRDELVRQPERYFRQRGLSFGIEKGEEHSDGEDVVSASIQTISRDSRLKRFDPYDFDMIIVDEAQHAAAPTYRKVLSYFHPRKTIGLTATPKRGDGVRLTDEFDSICYVKDMPWGIRNRYLSRLRCVAVEASFDMKKVKKQMGDFTAKSLSDEMGNSDDSAVVAKAYMDYCYKDNRQTLIYCPTQYVSKVVCGAIKEVLPETKRKTIACLTDKTKPESRKRMLKDYKAGKIRCIVNCMILTEGTDLPSTSAIIVNRPSANPTLYQQIVGRGTRLSEGKDYCLVIDVVGKNANGRKICTAPTLFGIDPDALPKAFQSRLVNTDLLEVTDEIVSETVNLAKNARLKTELFTLYADEYENIVKENNKNGAKQIAEEYNKKYINRVIEDYDFGDLLVRTTPITEKYYRIDATYKSAVYLSKPDMLGKTRVTFDVAPGDISINRTYLKSAESPLMDMDDAIRLVQRFLDTFASHPMYRIKWSKRAHEHMEYSKATDKQLYRIKNNSLLKKYDVPADENLTKKDASELIDLTIEEENLRTDAKKADLAAKAAERLNQKDTLSASLAKKKADEELSEKRQKNFSSLMKTLDEAAEEIQRQKNIRNRISESSDKDHTFSFTLMVYNERENRKPSGSQKAYITGLISDIRKAGGTFNSDIVRTVSMDNSYLAGYVIAFLLEVRKRVSGIGAGAGSVLIDSRTFMKQLSTARRSQTGKTVKFFVNYSVRR